MRQITAQEANVGHDEYDHLRESADSAQGFDPESKQAEQQAAQIFSDSAKSKRYWVYAHDSDGDLVEDLGDFEAYRKALDAAGWYLQRSYIRDDMTYNHTVRVVDRQLQDTTVWLAGPIETAGPIESLCKHGGVFRGETCSKCGKVVR